MKKTCSNCLFVSQDFSKLSDYKRSFVNEDTYTCIGSGGTFNETWTLHNISESLFCGGHEFKSNPDKTIHKKAVIQRQNRRNQALRDIENHKKRKL